MSDGVESVESQPLVDNSDIDFEKAKVERAELQGQLIEARRQLDRSVAALELSTRVK